MAQLLKSELDEIFVDVRKSFRLLYYYQRRVLDTINFISDSLSTSVICGYTLYSGNTPRNGGKIDLEALAWDWLIMFGYEFYFEERKVNFDNYQFAIAIQSDSGYDDAMSGVSMNLVEQFSPVEQSATKIYFYVGKNAWKPEAFDDAWAKDAKNDFEYESGNNQVFISKRFDLSDFRNEDEIVKRLQEVKEYFSSKGIEYFKYTG